MSAPIRPLPTEAASQRTENGAITSTRNDLPDFGEILDSQVEGEDEKPGEPEKPTPFQCDPWTLLGVAPGTPLPLPPAPVISFGPESSASPPVEAPEATAIESAPALPLSVGSEKKNEIEGAGQGIRRLALLADEKKLPAAISGKAEEIAGKGAVQAKNERGIPAAKDGSMLLATENFDGVRTGDGDLRPIPAMERAATLHPVAPSTKEKGGHPPVSNSGFKNASELGESVQIPVAVRPLSKVERFAEFTPEAATRFEPVVTASVSEPVEVHRAVNVQPAEVIESIREHVQVIRATRDQELQVVLRPDSHTELHLQVRNVDGQIQVQARCERGDFAWLESQWNGIQHALNTQGVRVEPLQAPAQTNDRPASGFSMNQERGSQRDPQRPNSLFSIEQDTPLTIKTAKRPNLSFSSVRGWQSWA